MNVRDLAFAALAELLDSRDQLLREKTETIAIFREREKHIDAQIERARAQIRSGLTQPDLPFRGTGS